MNQSQMTHHGNDNRVSEVVDGARCFLHTTAGKGAEQLKAVDEKMKQLTTSVGTRGVVFMLACRVLQSPDP